MTIAAPERLAATARATAVALLAAPVLIGVVLTALLGQPAIIPALLGAAGWVLALVLRQPVALIATRSTTRERAALIVGWISGPAEEIVRLGLVLLITGRVADAVWAGFGWATIEVLIVMVNLLVISNLMTRNDPKSIEARELLEAQGMLKQTNPAWGVLERVSATALHLGFTLMLFAQPWLVLVTLPLHSVTNMLTVRFVKSRLAATELALLAWSVLVLVAGAALAI